MISDRDADTESFKRNFLPLKDKAVLRILLITHKVDEFLWIFWGVGCLIGKNIRFRRWSWIKIRIQDSL